MEKKETMSFAAVLRGCSPYMSGYRSTLVATLLCVFGAECAGLVLPLCLRGVFARLRFDQGPSIESLLLWMLLLHAVAAIFRAGQVYYGHVIGYGMMCRIREEYFRNLQRLSMQFYEAKSTGAVLHTDAVGIPQFEVIFAHTLPSLIRCAVVVGGVTGVLFWLNPTLALWALVPIPVLCLFTRKVVTRMAGYYRNLGHRGTRILEFMADTINGLKIVQAFTREPHQAAGFSHRNQDYYDYSQTAMRVAGMIVPTSSFVIAAGTILVIWRGSKAIGEGTLTSPDLLAYLLYLGFFYSPILEMNALIDAISMHRAYAEPIFETIRTEPAIADAADAVAPANLAGTVEFSDVEFAYEASQPVLRGISLRVEAGQMVALVGPSGVGKTTITSLIPRFYEPRAGTVRVGGIDVRKLKLDALRSRIAMVPQDTFLFNVTIRENIAFGRIDATEEEIQEASRLAHCHEFISSFEKGYDTVVGERGLRLSGGQKQRVSIARALLRRAPILILDEATSAVDSESEVLIQAGLDHLMKRCTTIVIAHRLSTIRRADRIFVVEGGRVVEAGNHHELLEKGGAYARLHNLQFADHAGTGGRLRRVAAGS